MAKIATILLNLGGPDRLEAVRPFLFNLFYDPAITEMPAPLRWLFAKAITVKREKAVQANYAVMGGKTPLLEETRAQIEALEPLLSGLGDMRCFMAMRYWHPMSEEAVAEVKAFDPELVLLLPLYPQYSAATTGSSLRAWQEAAWLRSGACGEDPRALAASERRGTPKAAVLGARPARELHQEG
jgi:protoporphyrin/coproporphyrin ferrochelatase